jgi:hypothetical protein
MTHKIATVTETRRYHKTVPCYEATLDCAHPHEGTIHLDSPQWFAWLEAPENDAFSYALHNHAKGYIDGFMTVRKERRQRGGAYWSAYRRRGAACANSTSALRRRSLRPGSLKPPFVCPSEACPTATTNCKLQLQRRYKGGKTSCRPNSNPAALRRQHHPSDASS